MASLKPTPPETAPPDHAASPKFSHSTRKLIETGKLNPVDLHAWLAGTLTAIVQGHKQAKINQLIPWNDAATV